MAGTGTRQGVPEMLVRLVAAARIVVPIAIVSAIALAAEAGQRWW